MMLRSLSRFFGLSSLVGAAVLSVLIGCALPAAARTRRAPARRQDPDSLAAYLSRVESSRPAQPYTLGSIWVDNGPLSYSSGDVQALRVGDLITIHVTENTTAVGAGSVQAKRSFQAQSGLAQMFGNIGPTSGLANLFGPSSSQNLGGQAQTASSTLLTTSLTGQVVAQLPNGLLVVEARRSVEMNNQKQTAILRGLVRPADVAPDNSVPSTSLGDLEVELAGKGVISDNTRPPNILTRLALKIFGF